MDERRDRDVDRLAARVESLERRALALSGRVSVLESLLGASTGGGEAKEELATGSTPAASMASSGEALKAGPSNARASDEGPCGEASGEASGIASDPGVGRHERSWSGLVRARSARVNAGGGSSARVSGGSTSGGSSVGAAFDMSRFEWMLGTRGLAAAGLVIVVVGVGMFFKLAWDEGWVRAVPPSLRCVAGAVFGLALVSVGEVLRRRVNALASSGVSAAGIAVVYASILAASRFFDVLGVPWAFVLLAGTTFGGVVLGSLSSRVQLAVLSLVGAFLAPVVLSTGSPSAVVMPAYLLSLLVLGLGLAGWRGPRYGIVRQVAWWGTGVLGTMWMTTVMSSSPWSVLAFAIQAWVVTVIELMASARFFEVLRRGSVWPSSGAASLARDEGGALRLDLRVLTDPGARWLNSVFGATVWASIASALAWRSVEPALDFAGPLLFGVASLFAWSWGGGAMRDRHPRGVLATALFVNAVLLGVATIALALGGWIQVVAWCAVGLGAIETGRRLRFPVSGWFGACLLGVATVRLATLDLLGHLGAEASLVVGGAALTAWSAQVLFVVACWVVAASRASDGAVRRVGACLSPWLLAASVAHPSTSSWAMGLVMLSSSAASSWLNVRFRVSGVRTGGAILAMSGTIVLLVSVFSLTSWPSPGAAMGVLLGAAMWGALAALPSSTHAWRVGSSASAIGCLLLASHATFGVEGWVWTVFVASFVALMAMASGRVLWRWSLVEIGVCLSMLSGLGWFAHVLMSGSSVLAGTPILHAWAPPALLALAGLVIGGWIVTRQGEVEDAAVDLGPVRAALRSVAFGGAWVLLLWASTMELERGARMVLGESTGRDAAWSIWWSVYGVASVVIGLRLSPALRRAGLVLLSLVALKVLVSDTVTLSAPARVVASITVGLLIIGAGIAYARFARAFGAGDEGGRMTDADGPGTEELDGTSGRVDDGDVVR